MFALHRLETSAAFATRTVFAALLIFASLMTPAAAYAQSEDRLDPCRTPRILETQEHHRSHPGAVGEAHCYRLDIASFGLLYLDASAADSPTSGVQLRLRGQDREGGTNAAESLRTLDRGVTEHLLLASTGRYFLEIRAEDPRQALPAYRLTSRWVEIESTEIDGIVPHGNNIVVPGKTETNGEIELEPETVRHHSLIDRLCATATSDDDDHADLFACATPITREVSATLRDGWNRDVDVFRFDLERWSTVAITMELAAGASRARGSLHDGFGQRIGALEPADNSDPSRLVKTLAPGAYFLRVEGAPESTYTLSVSSTVLRSPSDINELSI